MDEYRQCLDKKQFISDKQKRCTAILRVCSISSLSLIFLTSFQQHAKKCEAWQNQRVPNQNARMNRKSASGSGVGSGGTGLRLFFQS